MSEKSLLAGTFGLVVLVCACRVGTGDASWDGVAEAARTLDGVADAEILATDADTGLIQLLVDEKCSAAMSRDLQDRLRRQLEQEELAVSLAPRECRTVLVPRRAPAPAESVIFDFAVSLFSGSVEDLAAAATTVSGVAAAEGTRKGGTSLMLHLILAEACDEHDGAALADQVKSAAAEQGVEATLTAWDCRRVIVARDGSPEMSAGDNESPSLLRVTASN